MVSSTAPVNGTNGNGHVPSAAYTQSLDGQVQSPRAQVVESISTEPELAQLTSLVGGTVIVTGGARGLGLTMAGAAVEAGANVHCCDILASPSDEEWSVMKQKAKRHNAEVSYHRLDICDKNAVRDVFTDIFKTSSRPVTGIVHAAGIMHEQPALDYDMDAFRRIMLVNVDGSMIVAQAAARLFVEQGHGGSIVLIASLSGFVANRGLLLTAYNSSKAACHQMCRSLSVELGQYNIRVNTVSPGYIRTAMTNLLLQDKPETLKRWEGDNPLGRIANPSELKGPTVFLLSKASSFITGSDIRVDGGHSAW